MKRILLLIFCLLISCTISYAHKPPAPNRKGDENNSTLSSSLASQFSRHRIYPEWGYFIDISAGLSTINKNNLPARAWSTEGKFAYSINAGFFYSLNSMFQIKSGIGISSYDISFTGSGEFLSPELTDIDNDTYTENLTLLDASHSLKTLYLSVPVTFEFSTASVNKIGYYVDLGAEYSFLLDQSISAEGTYTTKGIYQQWGVTLEDIPELGFYTKELEPENNINKSMLSLHGGSGVTIPVSGVAIFKVGVNAVLGLTNIGSLPQLPENSPISKQTQQFRSSYITNPATVKGSKIRYIGLELGFIFSKRVK